MKNHLLLLLAILLLGALITHAQEQTGEIFGTVKDTEGGPLPGVTIEARSPSHIGVTTAIADEIGRYRLLALTPGTYSITFSLPGFQTLRREDILVRLGKTFNLDVILSQAAIEEEVTVISESPVVDIKRSSTAMNIGKGMFTKLPRGRDYTSVVSVTTGGVNDEPLLGGTSMDGASGSENMFFVDGVDTTDMYSGTSAQRVLFEFVEEVQVKSSGYAAEYGGSMGGVINVITRSGGNEYPRRGQCLLSQ